ncbi:MAG: lysine--tRNA ligase [Planctomycetes bacterium]|nr:lysine--tRNA ligase [Planctomycetota bacterium]
MIEYEDFRLDTLEALRERGIDPFGGRFPDTQSIASIRESFEEDNPKAVRAAGRITNLRDMGKASFVDIKDKTGSIQIFFQEKRLGEENFEVYQQLQAADIVGVSGDLTKTRTGEITIFVDKFQVLSKALLRPPEKWHGLKDEEFRYRRRSVDLFTNDEVMERFLLRSELNQSIRSLLQDRGFIEVETPMMQPIPGGAAARPFVTHHNALDIDLYLRVAPELYLKRLLVGGMERVFEINRNFRNEGVDRQHNPEFTSLELYQAYADYSDMRELTEDLIRSLALNINSEGLIQYGDYEIDFTVPFQQVDYREAFEEKNDFPPDDSEKLREKAQELDLDVSGTGDELLLERVFERTVEDEIIHPTFIFDYPAALSPLTKPCPDDEAQAQRWDLFIGGLEMGTAYTELNDPQLQEEKFLQQLEGEDAEQETLRTVDLDFLRALAHGMPPAGGMGVGIDRLVMLLSDSPSIREVILFPLLRPIDQE